MNPIKQRIARGEMVTASWAELASPDAAEIMVRHGWSVILIDGEHGPGGLEDWVATARAVEAAGGEVVLRVPDGSDTVLKRVLDRGFRSLVVPQVNTLAQAEAIAAACLYPPRGRRGYAAPIVRASGFGARSDYALETAHDDLLLMVQCEHVEAVENAGAIAAVPGVDGIFIGPNDLAGSIGRLERLEEEEVQELIARTEAEVTSAGAFLATITGAGRSWGDLKRLGYRFVAGTNDVSLLAHGAAAAARARDADLG